MLNGLALIILGLDSLAIRALCGGVSSIMENKHLIFGPNFLGTHVICSA